MLEPSQLVYVLLEVLMAVLAVLGNVLVCWAVRLNSNLQTVTNLFVVSLAVADVAVGLLAIPSAIVISTGICAQFFGCLFITCFVLILTQSSIFSLLAIAVDRYVAITNPLRYASLVTGQRAKVIIGLCWLLALGIGLLPMLGWNNGPNATAPSGPSSCPEGLSQCLFEGVVPMDYMIYFNFGGCVLLPLLLMLVIYVHIFLAARRQLLRMGPKVAPAPTPPESSSSSSKRPQSTLKKEVHAAKSLAIIVGFFALCWLPLHLINCFNYLCQRCERAHVWLINAAIILSHANSVGNPFIYAFRIREFRQTFRRILDQHILRRRHGAGPGPQSGEDPPGADRSITPPPSGTSKEASLCSSSFLDPPSDRVPAADSSRRWTSADAAAASHRLADKRDANGPPHPARQTCTVGLAEADVPPNLQGSVAVGAGPSSDLQGSVGAGPSSDLQGSLGAGPSSTVTFVSVKPADRVCSASLTDVS